MDIQHQSSQWTISTLPRFHCQYNSLVHEPHYRHVPINKIWRWTESTPWSGWWRSHMADIYSDCSTHEINNDCSVISTAVKYQAIVWCSSSFYLHKNTVAFLINYMEINCRQYSLKVTDTKNDSPAFLRSFATFVPRTENPWKQDGFYRAMLCIRGTSHGPVSVCLCLSHVGVLLKRHNVGSHKQHHTIPQGV